MHISRIVTGRWKENCYLVVGKEKNAVIIDPGENFKEIETHVDSQKLKVEAVLNTHAHFDHVAAVDQIKKKYGAQFYLHKRDFKLLSQANLYRSVFEGQASIPIPQVDGDLSEMSQVSAAGLVFHVLPTPGHTPGGVCFLIEENLFCGDTVLNEKIGRTDLPGGNHEELKKSLSKVLELPRTTLLWPGHGDEKTLEQVLAINKDLAEMIL